MSFWATVKADLSAYERREVSHWSRLKKVRRFLRAYLDTDFRVVFQMRLIHRLAHSPLKSIGLLLYYRQKSRYCVDLSPWAFIGPGLRFQHPFNIVIGPEVRIGSNCMLFNGVTLGNARPDIMVNRMPSVGDNCILGTGVKVFGQIYIGDDLLVGANVVVRENLLKGNGYFNALEGARKVRVRRPAASA